MVTVEGLHTTIDMVGYMVLIQERIGKHTMNDLTTTQTN